ncbi:histidine phosphatase family protein [Chloroflexota bacterium]
MLRLLLVRHGETRWNLERRIQGAGSDVELSGMGKIQAQRLSQVFKDEDLAGIYSSPLQRARTTAEAIARPHDMEAKLEARLKEIDAGDLEGVLVESLGYNLSQFLVPEPGGRMTDLPGGEGLDDLQERAWSVVEGILETHQTGQVIVLSHYFTILTIICRALGFPLSAVRRMRAAPGSISTIAFLEHGPMLFSLNETCHLTSTV